MALLRVGSEITTMRADDLLWYSRRLHWYEVNGNSLNVRKIMRNIYDPGRDVKEKQRSSKHGLSSFQSHNQDQDIVSAPLVHLLQQEPQPAPEDIFRP